jgi:hypothetical protein
MIKYSYFPFLLTQNNSSNFGVDNNLAVDKSVVVLRQL